MKQLVQLKKELVDSLKTHNARVMVVFREESEGQVGLRRVVEQTDTQFTLTLDRNGLETARYSPGKMVHDSYIIDANGVVIAVLAGTRYDRAQAAEFALALNDVKQTLRQ